MASLSSAASSTSSVTLSLSSWWLKNPEDPSLNLAISIVDDKLTMKRPIDAAFFSPLGRDRKVKVGELARGVELQAELEFFDLDELRSFEWEINIQGRVWLLQSPFSEQWYVAQDGSFTTHQYNYPDYFTGDLGLIEVDQP